MKGARADDPIVLPDDDSGDWRDHDIVKLIDTSLPLTCTNTLGFNCKFEAQGPNKSCLFRTSSVTKRYSQFLTYRSRYAPTGCPLSRLERGRSDDRNLLNPAVAWTRACKHRRRHLEWVGDCFPSTRSPSASPRWQITYWNNMTSCLLESM